MINLLKVFGPITIHTLRVRPFLRSENSGSRVIGQSFEMSPILHETRTKESINDEINSEP